MAANHRAQERAGGQVAGAGLGAYPSRLEHLQLDLFMGMQAWTETSGVSLLQSRAGA